MSRNVAKRKRIYLKEKPAEKIGAEHFELREEDVPEPKVGEVLVKGLYISLDAAMRAWMQGRTYRSEVAAGVVMPGLLLGEVIESRDPSLPEGALVEGDMGWQDYAVAPARSLMRRKAMKPLTHLLSAYGITGRTAYFGMMDIGRPKPGDVVLVSAAAGAVGSLAAQMARMAGARVVGIAGSDKKCAYLTETLKLDAAVSHRDKRFFAALQEACPDGIDLYFDNVGGEVLEAALFLMNERGRVVCCGAVSQYDAAPGPTPGPRGIPGLLVVKRLEMRGFIVMDYAARLAEADGRVASWIAEKKLAVPEDIVEGIEKTPQALIGLLHGENIGKRIVKI